MNTTTTWIMNIRNNFKVSVSDVRKGWQHIEDAAVLHDCH